MRTTQANLGYRHEQTSSIYEHVVKLLDENFGIESASIKPESKLYDDLDIDSIDAVDLIVQLQPLVGKRLNAEAFKSVRTVQDVVDALYLLVNEDQPAAN